MDIIYILNINSAWTFTTTFAIFPGDNSWESRATCRRGSLSRATCRSGKVDRKRSNGIPSRATFPGDNAGPTYFSQTIKCHGGGGYGGGSKGYRKNGGSKGFGGSGSFAGSKGY
nr:hypothetical protein [Tanacetum cinerariifolium]